MSFYLEQKTKNLSLNQNFLKNTTLDVTELKYLNFYTTDPGPYKKECQSAYALWKKVWKETFNELNVQKKSCSDDFIHRYVCGLFKGEEAIGFILHQNMDLTLDSSIDRIYFDNYPEVLKKYQMENFDHVFVPSYMTIHPDWRKSQTNYSISELIISLVILEFNFTDTQRLIGYFRNNRSTNQIFYRHAGRFLHQESAYNVTVDFAEIDKDTSQLSNLKDHAVVSIRLWNEFQNTKEKRLTNGTEINHTIRKHDSIGRKIQKPKMEQQIFL